VGTKISGPTHISCTNFDKLLVLSKDGTYKVIHIPEKQYIEQLVWVGVVDKTTVLNVVYKHRETQQAWAKRFVVDKFILDKSYRYLEENTELEYLSSNPNAFIELFFTAQARQTEKRRVFSLKDVLVKGAQTRGVKLAHHKVKQVKEVKK